MRINREKKEQKIHNQIQEWNTYTTIYDILQNHSNYPTVCLLLDTAHRTDHCITVCGKCRHTRYRSEERRVCLSH